MATPYENIVYLLAQLVSAQTGKGVEQIMEESDKYWETYHIEYDKKNKISSADIDRIYHLYPAKCPFRGANLGKCSKNKAQIERLCRLTGVEDVYERVKRYVEDATKDNVYFKNFSTLLNNLPDYSDSKLEQETKQETNIFNWQ